MSDVQYQTGFGNTFATEAKKGTLPQGQNSPQKVAHGLYAEQISGSAFTMPRTENKRTWAYRMRPSVVHMPYEEKPFEGAPHFLSAPIEGAVPPSQMRWNAMSHGKGKDFIEGIYTIGANGSIDAWSGLAVHTYHATENMTERFFYNADGEMLIVPQHGRLHLHTEMGVLHVAPQEIVVIPRGIKFRAELPDGEARGYICENYGSPFRLPDLGPIGANGLANPRDFLTPVAAYEDREGDFEMIGKFAGHLWRAPLGHSPLDVVAWHGNYAPYKYDLNNFNTINTVSFDHPDPSIFTVLTAPTTTHGLANVDFVIFPPRWMVAKDTFRPPYYHRNIMSEFMGLITGIYDGKEGGGFEPGGMSLHNCMSAHGPDANTFEKASNAELSPQYMDSTLAFMFESCYIIRPTKQAQTAPERQADYNACWQGLEKKFEG